MNAEIRLRRDTRIMNVLSDVAAEVEPVGGAKLAAAIVLKNEIISIGVNSYKSHPLQKLHPVNDHDASVCLHSEIHSIVKALKRITLEELEKATIYVCRVKKDKHSHGLAKPCKGCSSAIAAFNLKRVVYTTDKQNTFVTVE